MRHASCSCGQLRVNCGGEPTRVSICHCLECQKRTGSVFAVQARSARADIEIVGEAQKWTRAGDSGGSATFSFCAVCASTVFWEPDGADYLYMAVGAFADPTFPPPHVSVYEERQHPRALAAKELPLEHQF